MKRLSDRFDEECEALVAGGHDPEDADEHDFFVPKRARWSEIQKVATNLGETLNKACAALEEKNTALEGVLAGIDYNDERKLGEVRNRDVVLARLVQHFSKLNVRNANLSEPDMLGRAYEYLVEKFADDAGKKGGEFYTPRRVVRLIVELLKPAEGMRICDPTCGSGGMLIFGQEKNLAISSFAFGPALAPWPWFLLRLTEPISRRGPLEYRRGHVLRGHSFSGLRDLKVSRSG